MKYRIHLSMLACALAILPFSAYAETLTLEQAVNGAIEKSPALAASGSRAAAANASYSGAGAFANPDVSIEAENIFGDGPYKGTDAAEITYGVSQLIELPGKRSSRIEGADAERKLAGLNRDAARLDLIRDVSIAYAEAVAAEQNLVIATAEQKLASDVSSSVTAKVEAGKVPPIQQRKAEIELSSSEMGLDKASRQVSVRKAALANLMGAGNATFELDELSMPPIKQPEPLTVYQAMLSNSPDIKSFDKSIDYAQSQLSLEKARLVPDPTFNVGVRDYREDGQQALVAGLSFPLPVFNANRAQINRAGHEMSAAKADRQGAALSAEKQLIDAYDDFVSGYRTAIALDATVLPGAEEAFSIAREGYDAGKFEYLEVLDAQRTLFAARKERNDAILDYHRQRALIERLTATHFRSQGEK